MHPELKRVLRWGCLGGAIFSLCDWIYSGGMPMSERVVFALMVFCSGFVACAMCAANFSKEGGEAHGTAPHAGGAAGHETPPAHGPGH